MQTTSHSPEVNFGRDDPKSFRNNRTNIVDVVNKALDVEAGFDDWYEKEGKAKIEKTKRTEQWKNRHFLLNASFPS
jgi:lipocalin